MNRKQLILILIFLVVIGGAGLILLNRDRESWTVPETRMGDKALPNFQPNDVAVIHIKGASDLNLVHTNDRWRVRERHDYPANFHQISDVLIKLKELKVVEANTVEPSDLARVNLEEPGKGPGSGTLVEFKDAQGKVMASLLVGKKQMRARDESSPSPFVGGEADGCYVLLPGNPREALLISDPLTALQPNPQTWLSRDFFKVENPKSISLQARNPSDSWTLARETESSSWALAGAKSGETFDSARMYALTSALTAPRFNDVIPSNAPVHTGLENPQVLTLETFDYFTYTLKIGGKAPDGSYYATVAVAATLPASGPTGKLQEKLKQEQALAPWIFEINSWILDPLLRTRSQLLQTRESSPAETRPGKNSPIPGWTPRVIQ